jgi:hypothetical protein
MDCTLRPLSAQPLDAVEIGFTFQQLRRLSLDRFEPAIAGHPMAQVVLATSLHSQCRLLCHRPQILPLLQPSLIFRGLRESLLRGDDARTARGSSGLKPPSCGRFVSRRSSLSFPTRSMLAARTTSKGTAKAQASSACWSIFRRRSFRSSGQTLDHVERRRAMQTTERHRRLRRDRLGWCGCEACCSGSGVRLHRRQRADHLFSGFCNFGAFVVP